MKVIEKAFDEALNKTKMEPRKGWWGVCHNGKHYIMRYAHTILIFDDIQAAIVECCTRSDKRGIEDALRMVKQWRGAK